VFDELIAKGEEYGYKVGRTLANQVVERRNMINYYLRGRSCIESVRGSLIQGEFFILSFSWLFFAILFDLPFFVSFVGLAIFSSSR
jgi:hypothetical protein